MKIAAASPVFACRKEKPIVDYHHVEKLFDMLVEYFHNMPPPEEHDAHGEWVRVRDGLQGAEHCIRVLTPDEFEEWHRAVEMPIKVEPGRRPVAFCSHEGVWWVIYSDTDESEVIAAIREVLRGAVGWTPAGRSESGRTDRRRRARRNQPFLRHRHLDRSRRLRLSALSRGL